MNSDEARHQAAAAQHAFRDASRPPLPLPLSIVGALAAGAGVTLVGQSPDSTWLHIVALVVGIALLAVAHLVPTLHRQRKGLFGYRGQVQRDNLVFLICAVVLVIIGLNATATLSVIYLGLGVVTAIAYFLLLRGVWGAPQ